MRVEWRSPGLLGLKEDRDMMRQARNRWAWVVAFLLAGWVPLAAQASEADEARVEASEALAHAQEVLENAERGDTSGMLARAQEMLDHIRRAVRYAMSFLSYSSKPEAAEFIVVMQQGLTKTEAMMKYASQGKRREAVNNLNESVVLLEKAIQKL